MPLFWLSLISLGLGFAAFITFSSLFSALNIAVGIAAGLVTLAAATFIALSVTGHDWRQTTGLTRFHGGDVLAGAALALANSLSVSNWFGELSAKIFPQFILDLFDTSRVLAGAMTNRIEQTVVVIAVVVLAPLAEEFFFRGVLFHGLTRRFGIVSSAVISGVVFSAYQLDPGGFLARAEIGFLLALLVWKTGSLWPAIAAHAANNALASGLMLAEVPDTALPTWAGLSSLAALVGLSAWLWRRPTREAVDDPPVTRASFIRVTAPWLVGFAIVAAVVYAVDARGGQLTRIDLSAPLLGAGDEAQEAALRRLRAQARAGDAAVDEYRAKREALSQARFKAMIERLVPAKKTGQ